MTQKEHEVLKDFKAYIDRMILEDDFGRCLVGLARDTSEILMNGPETTRVTQDEFGKVILVS